MTQTLRLTVTHWIDDEGCKIPLRPGSQIEVSFDGVSVTDGNGECPWYGGETLYTSQADYVLSQASHTDLLALALR